MDRHTQGGRHLALPPPKAVSLPQARPLGRENTAAVTHPHAHLARQPRLSRLPLHTQDKQTVRTQGPGPSHTGSAHLGPSPGAQDTSRGREPRGQSPGPWSLLLGAKELALVGRGHPPRRLHGGSRKGGRAVGSRATGATGGSPHRGAGGVWSLAGLPFLSCLHPDLPPSSAKGGGLRGLPHRAPTLRPDHCGCNCEGSQGGTQTWSPLCSRWRRLSLEGRPLCLGPGAGSVWRWKGCGTRRRAGHVGDSAVRVPPQLLQLHMGVVGKPLPLDLHLVPSLGTGDTPSCAELRNSFQAQAGEARAAAAAITTDCPPGAWEDAWPWQRPSQRRVGGPGLAMPCGEGGRSTRTRTPLLPSLPGGPGGPREP